ncbi:hypothetical protein GCM10029992_29140 [Glycomyces albus]
MHCREGLGPHLLLESAPPPVAFDRAEVAPLDPLGLGGIAGLAGLGGHGAELRPAGVRDPEVIGLGRQQLAEPNAVAAPVRVGHDLGVPLVNPDTRSTAWPLG